MTQQSHFQFYVLGKLLDMHVHQEAHTKTLTLVFISVVGNSKTLETTQISNDSRRDKLWYFYVMDLKTNEQQLVHQNGMDKSQNNSAFPCM